MGLPRDILTTGSSFGSRFNAELVLGSLSCFHQSPFMSLDARRRLPEPHRS
jgi:hypothetical protein